MRLFRMALLLVIGFQLSVPNSWPVKTASGSPAVEPVDQIHLAWTGDPATTLTVTWHSPDLSAPNYLEYRAVGASTWLTETATIRPAGTVGPLYQADLTGLSADTFYEYHIPGAGGMWSSIYTTRTAPPAGTAGFDVVYVADTGIAGRPDGLASGTERVQQTIESLQPRLVLGGGDYAAFDTDNRFTDPEPAIDAWFNQIQSLAAGAPFMPAYGNHEYSDTGGYDVWAARFPTPSGYDGSRFYSFDAGNAHFISIYAPVGTITTPAMQWIEADIQAAQAAGKAWIIPYLHVSPFSDGGNHSASPSLQNELGPLFEAYGIRLVLSAHDQSYERTLPLVDVPDTDTPTTNRMTCYQPSDGPIWLKASPGGKLSNINWDFSEFQTWPAPAYTALRTNELFSFVQLKFNNDQSLTVNGYGVPERGGSPHLIESFDLSNQSCGHELAFTPNVMEQKLDFDASPKQVSVNLSSSDGSTPGPVNIQSDAAWMTGSCAPSGACSLQLDPSGLNPGSYPAWLTADAAGYRQGRILVVLEVLGDTAQYTLQVSSSPDRTNPQSLHGATISGQQYIFTDPVNLGIGQVQFFIDHLAAQRENNPPYDLAGTGAGGAANPFYTTVLSNGSHNIGAVIVADDGSTELASATFQVDNPAPVAPISVQIAGPLLGQVGQVISFSASTQPISTTLPVTYTWFMTDQVTVTHTSNLSDSINVSWNTPGTKQIMLEASNPASSVQTNHTIVIAQAINYRLFLPSIQTP